MACYPRFLFTKSVIIEFWYGFEGLTAEEKVAMAKCATEYRVAATVKLLIIRTSLQITLAVFVLGGVRKYLEKRIRNSCHNIHRIVWIFKLLWHGS